MPTEFIRPATPEFLRCNKREDISETDTTLVNPSSYSKPESSSSQWFSRLSTKQMALKKIQQKAIDLQIAGLDRQTKITIGCLVKTKNRLIAPLSPYARNKRKSRMEVFGTVISRSAYQPRFWLVQFKNMKTFYCTDKVLSLSLL